MTGTSNDITLGEVGRNVEATRKEVGDLRKDVTELKVSDAASTAKIDRLERIVYGALGTAVASLITAIIAALVVAAR